MNKSFNAKTQLSPIVLITTLVAFGLSACEERIVRTDLVVAEPAISPAITMETVGDPVVTYDPQKDAMTDSGYVLHREANVGMYTGSQMQAPLVNWGPGNFHNPNRPIR